MYFIFIRQTIKNEIGNKVLICSFIINSNTKFIYFIGIQLVKFFYDTAFVYSSDLV